jgi:hypothetical protein
MSGTDEAELTRRYSTRILSRVLDAWRRQGRNHRDRYDHIYIEQELRAYAAELSRDNSTSERGA